MTNSVQKGGQFWFLQFVLETISSTSHCGKKMDPGHSTDSVTWCESRHPWCWTHRQGSMFTKADVLAYSKVGCRRVSIVEEFQYFQGQFNVSNRSVYHRMGQSLGHNVCGLFWFLFPIEQTYVMVQIRRWLPYVTRPLYCYHSHVKRVVHTKSDNPRFENRESKSPTLTTHSKKIKCFCPSTNFWPWPKKYHVIGRHGGPTGHGWGTK